MIRYLRLWLWLLCAFRSAAHIGSPYVLFEGRAGGFPVRVSIREPDVVPGLAEIAIRVIQGSPQRITVLPLDHRADRTRAPRPDVAERVTGDPQLYTASLWFMQRGAYAVEVTVEGPDGGRVIVPVDSLARRQEPMGPLLSSILSALGLLLVVGWISIVASAASQSRKGPEYSPKPTLGWRPILGAVVGTGIMYLLLRGGANWWASEAATHQEHVLFHPMDQSIQFRTNEGRRVLQFQLSPPPGRRDWGPLIPDHGRLVHLFLIQDTVVSGKSPAFAHLHPQLVSNRYDTILPPLPAGLYRSYADLTHDSGVTETVTNRIQLEAPISEGWSPSDFEDSFVIERPFESVVETEEGITLELRVANPRTGVPVELQVLVRDSRHQPVALEPYLRMLGHAVIERSDGQVFAHVHPAGTLSMAVARQLAMSAASPAERKSAGVAADINCGDLAAVPDSVADSLRRSGEVAFPYVFPAAGGYRVWVQVRAAGKIHTGCFEIQVPGNGALASGTGIFQ